MAIEVGLRWIAGYPSPIARGFVQAGTSGVVHLISERVVREERIETIVVTSQPPVIVNIVRADSKLGRSVPRAFFVV